MFLAALMVGRRFELDLIGSRETGVDVKPVLGQQDLLPDTYSVLEHTERLDYLGAVGPNHSQTHG